MVVSVLIVRNIFSEAAEFFSAEDFSWSSLAGSRRGIFDVWTPFIGTLWITGIAIALAGPVGLGVAFYLRVRQPQGRQIIKPIIETLASIPSVVLGLFALSFITPQVLQPLDDSIGFVSLLAAGLGVGILTVPIIASISEDAMRAVPVSCAKELRPRRPSGHHVAAGRFPAALSGISAAFIVGISRAIGETMVVFIAAGGSGGAVLEYDVRQEGQTFTAAMASSALAPTRCRCRIAFGLYALAPCSSSSPCCSMSCPTPSSAGSGRCTDARPPDHRWTRCGSPATTRRAPFPHPDHRCRPPCVSHGRRSWHRCRGRVVGSALQPPVGLSHLTSLADAGRAGVSQGIRGSILIAGIVILTFPIGIGAAIYLEEYANDTWVARLIQVTVRNPPVCRRSSACSASPCSSTDSRASREAVA